jgi:hypothetical protein
MDSEEAVYTGRTATEIMRDEGVLENLSRTVGFVAVLKV